MRGIEIIKETVKTAPESPGVYRMIDNNGTILYIGKAKNLPKRIISYSRIEQLTKRLQQMVTLLDSIEITTTDSEAEALLLEAALIKEHNPRFNIQLKDDKSFPYIALTMKHDFPRIMKHRGAKNKHNYYAGPYASAGMVNQAITILQKAFLLRPCSDSYFQNRNRPCLEYQIKRCSAPCVDKISTDEYAKLISQCKRFLSNQSHQVQAELQDAMEKASASQDYEYAAYLRDRLTAINSLQAREYVEYGNIENADIFIIQQINDAVIVNVAFIRNGNNTGTHSLFPKQVEGFELSEILSKAIGQFYLHNQQSDLLLCNIDLVDKDILSEAYNIKIETPKRGARKTLITRLEKNALQDLENYAIEHDNHKRQLQDLAILLNITKPIKRIETYDNSHLFGTNALGAMIVATENGLDKSEYRIFNVQSNGGDDIYMMKQVLERRLRKCLETNNIVPDLLLIDGGKTQLNAVYDVIKMLKLETKIHLAAIAKGTRRNSGDETLFQINKSPINLAHNNPILHYLQRLRDEAHRFAITKHRTKRQKNQFTSILDEIEGIGPARKKALLNHFGSIQAIKEASTEQIAGVSGINSALAKKIVNSF